MSHAQELLEEIHAMDVTDHGPSDKGDFDSENVLDNLLRDRSKPEQSALLSDQLNEKLPDNNLTAYVFEDNSVLVFHHRYDDYDALSSPEMTLRMVESLEKWF